MANMGHTMQYVLFIASSAILLSAVLNQEPYAAAQLPSSFQSTILTGSALQNNPVAQKILLEIEYSKKQIAQLEQQQKDVELNQKLIDEQRRAVAILEQQALEIMQTENIQHTPLNAFQSFVDTVPNNNTKKVFWGEFNYMYNKVQAGHAAMQRVLDNGGTWQDAIQVYYSYVATTHAELITVNKNLNIEYGLADPNVQNNFDAKGMLPPDYINVPDVVYSHSYIQQS